MTLLQEKQKLELLGYKIKREETRHIFNKGNHIKDKIIFGIEKTIEV